MSDVQVCTSLGGSCLAVGLDRGGALLLDTRCGDLACAWTAHGERINAVAADGHSLVTASQVSRACFWVH